jgi:peptide-methionine (S)-S-oxide reductase
MKGVTVFLRNKKLELPTPDQAPAGRLMAMPVADKHTVLGTPLTGPWPAGLEVAVFGMGCFWGAGGFTRNPMYEQTCSGSTGHAEVVQVVYDPSKIAYEDLLKAFWENHDPTQGMRQGNDVGTQYRSAIYTTTDDQARVAKASLEAFQPVVTRARRGQITTEIKPLTEYYYAEDYHQQYLSDAKNPYGYCNHGPNGLTCPVGVAKTGA